MKSISDKVHFRIEEKLYQEFQMFHLAFLQKTEYFEVEDIKNFIILLIEEWESKLKETQKWEDAPEAIITAVNRKGKRVGKLPYEGATTRITFYFKPLVKKKWNDVIYFLMKEENFSNRKEYTNGYFFPKLYDFAQKNEAYLVSKYEKELLFTYLLKEEDSLTINFHNKNTIKSITGKVNKIENTPKGIVVHIDRTT